MPTDPMSVTSGDEYLRPSEHRSYLRKWIEHYIRMAWFSRFPIGFAIIFILMGPLGLLYLPVVLESAYIVSNSLQLAALTALCLVAATIFSMQIAVIRARGRQRFLDLKHDGFRSRMKRDPIESAPDQVGDLRLRNLYGHWRWTRRRTLFWLVCGLSFPMTCFLNSLRSAADDFFDNQAIGLFSGILGFAVGFLLFFLIMQAAAIAHTLFYDMSKEPNRLLPMTPVLHSDAKAHMHIPWLKGKRIEQNGHWELGFWLIKFLVGYFVIYFVTRDSDITADSMLTAPFYLILLLTLWCQLLTAASYFLDYYRVSILFMVIVGVVFLQNFSHFDHRFRVSRHVNPYRDIESDRIRYASEQQSNSTSNPAEVRTDHKSTARVRDRATETEQSNRIIVVVAPGGGIHAAAWTGRVLSGLHERYRSEFENSLKLISAVSGGSVGAMYYLDNYPTLKFTSRDQTQGAREKFDDTTRRISRKASESSLDCLLWGAAFPDMMRLLPIIGSNISQDRGDVQERRWLRELDINKGIGPTLFEWRNKAIRKEMPWVAFNATEAETGRRVIFSTMHFEPNPNFPDGTQAIDYLSLSNYNFDLPISTAVRLSATFPYCSPASMPANDTLHLGHIVDGGYVDNDGLLTAIDAIRQWNAEDEAKTKEFIIIRIDHVPPPSDEMVSANDPGFGGAGWEYAAAGPLVAMGNVRTTSQRERGEKELELLAEGLVGRFKQYTIQFPRMDAMRQPPLNWKLTLEQRAAYELAWNEVVRVTGSFPPSQEERAKKTEKNMGEEKGLKGLDFLFSSQDRTPGNSN